MTDSNNNQNNDWCTIESDPGIFTEMLEMLQCKCIELNELYSLDDDTLVTLQNTTKQIYGFIFLFQYNTKTTNKPTSTASLATTDEDIPSDLFFAQQVTTNACATQAILSILFNSMNNPSSSSSSSSSMNDDNDMVSSSKTPTLLTHDEVGPILYPFYTFVSSFSYDLKGVAISSSEEIKRVHNTFGRAESMYMDTVSPRPIFDPLKHDKSDDVFHFISYVPYYPNNTVYELDGLQSSPIPLGSFEHDNTKQSSVLQPWIIVARDQIQKRIETIGVDNVKFNLMAMIHDKRQFYSTSEVSSNDDTMMMNDYDNVNYNALLEEENMKRYIWKLENERRRHNYIPFIIQYLREMAKTTIPPAITDNDDNEKTTTLLKQMITQSRTRQQEKRQLKNKKG